LHVCEAVSQTGAAVVQSAFDAQPTHRLDVVLHTGVGALQSPLLRQATHVFAMTSHLGAPGLVQSESDWHTTQEPAFMPEVTQAGPEGLPTQSALVAHAWHMCEVVLHTGVVPAQSVLNSQWTQVPVGKSHTAVPPVHWAPLVDEHCPHAPHTSHAGVDGVAVQSLSAAQALHVPALQMGVSPPQSVFERQPVQVLDARLQRGVAGGQSGSAMHATQVPSWALAARLSQYGVAGDPLQSALEPQGAQVCVVVLQIGVEPLQLASVRQPTHVLVAVLHTGVAPVHAE
jgi:hypothetical protein